MPPSAECRTTWPSKWTRVETGRITGAVLFFIAFKASRYCSRARPACLHARGVRVSTCVTVFLFSVRSFDVKERVRTCDTCVYVRVESAGGREVWHRSDFVVRIPSWIEFMMMG